MWAATIQVRDDVGLLIWGHAGICGGIVPHTPLHHVLQPLVSVGLAASTWCLLFRHRDVFEEEVLAHGGLLRQVAVLLVQQEVIPPGEGHGLEEPAYYR